jgi:hypothetical protein
MYRFGEVWIPFQLDPATVQMQQQRRTMFVRFGF